MVLVHDTSSHCALQMYEASLTTGGEAYTDTIPTFTGYLPQTVKTETVKL